MTGPHIRLKPLQMLAEVVDQLDKGLFADYVEPKAKFINSIIRKGILESRMDWLGTPRPSGAYGLPLLSSYQRLASLYLP